MPFLLSIFSRESFFLQQWYSLIPDVFGLISYAQAKQNKMPRKIGSMEVYASTKHQSFKIMLMWY